MISNVYQKAVGYDGNVAFQAAPVQKTPFTKVKQLRSRTRVKVQSAPVSEQPAAPEQSAAQPPQAKPAWKGAPLALATIFVVAAVVVATLISYANLVMVNDQVVSLRSELTQLQKEETKLMSQYELAYNLRDIEAQMLASGQMTKIQSWQTYTLELSEPDSVEYYQGWNVKEQLVSFAKTVISAVQEYF